MDANSISRRGAPSEPRVLFVDDDERLLQGIQRGLRKSFPLDIAVGPNEGLARVRAANPPYSVIVADMNMPGMDGSVFLERVRSLSPGSVRMMLTGNSDLDTAARAVNEGHVFRFISKPCPPQELAAFLRAGLDQHRLAASERRAAAHEEASQNKSNFLTIASHELRTPLSGIQSAAEILRDSDGLTELEHREFLGTILDASQRLDLIVTRILRMAELDGGMHGGAPRPLSSDAVRSLLEDARSASGAGRWVGSDGETDPAESGDAGEVWADPDHLKEIFSAILGNAARHAQGSDTRIGMERIGADLMISIDDDGPGIPEDVRGYLFQPFVQRADVLVGKPDGLGLGLAMARAMARSMRAELVHRTGERGHGARFELLLRGARVGEPA